MDVNSELSPDSSPAMILDSVKDRGQLMLWLALELPMEWRMGYSGSTWNHLRHSDPRGWLHRLKTQTDPYPGYQFRLKPRDGTDPANP